VPPTLPQLPADAKGLAVDVRGVSKRYDKVEALRGVDLQVHRGEMFALLGPNGAGKSTLFSILATLRAPTEGTAHVFGHDVTQERAAIRQDMGVVFQEPAIEQRLSGRDNLHLMGLFYGLKPRIAHERATALLARLGLTDCADRPAKNLSGGQRRKLELARALVTEPKILFLDEATLGLDVDARRGFWAEVRGLTAAGRTVFFATHYMEEAEVADRIALIDAGRIVALGTPAELKMQIGGGVIRLETDHNADARTWLAGRGFYAEPGDKLLMLVHPDPAAVVPEILRSLPVKVHRVSINEPSLEDVFLKLTGRGLGGEAPTMPARSNGGRSV
jgi:ABC-2 type transport system ATP-binding protein